MKLNAKKVLDMVLAGVLAAGSLTACGGSGTVSTIAADAAIAVSGDSQVAADTTTAVGEEKTLRIAMEYAYAPYNWTQPDDSNGAISVVDSDELAHGYNVMTVKKICDELGYDLEIVRPDWDSLIPVATIGKVDCATAGQSITSERLQAMDFTEPYYYVTIVTLVKEGSRYADAKSVVDLAGATCTPQQSTTRYNTCLPQIKGANVLVVIVSAPDMLMSLNVDKCDLVVIDQPADKGALVAYPNFKMVEFDGGENDFQVTDEDIDISISLKRGNTELQDAINSVLTKVTKGDFSQMMDEAISIQPLAN